MSVIKDQLWKYLAKLGNKGPAEAKLAGELNKKMRHDILASFVKRQDSDLALKTINAEAMPELARFAHPEVGYRQHSAALKKVWERTPQRDQDQIGKWTAMGQPSAKKLDDWLLLHQQRRAKIGGELRELDTHRVKHHELTGSIPAAVSKYKDRTKTLEGRRQRVNKAADSTSSLMDWLKKRQNRG